MKFIPTEIPGVLIIEPDVFGDARGFFMETYRLAEFRAAGIRPAFIQDSHSRSAKGVLRGLHYQVQHTQGKLIRAAAGGVFDVAVDLRRSSPTFGRWTGTLLSAENKCMFWLPPGFAHGHLTLTEEADVLYKFTDYYDAKAERCILWNDTTIGIHWPLEQGLEPILSAKDLLGCSFQEAEVFD